MTKAVVGIIGGSGVYNLPGLEDVREEKIETVAQRRREVGAVDSHWKPFRFWRTVSSHRR